MLGTGTWRAGGPETSTSPVASTSGRGAGGKRTTGLGLSTGIAERDMTDPAGENVLSRSYPMEDLLLIAMLGEYMLP